MRLGKHNTDRNTKAFFELVRAGLWADANHNFNYQVKDNVAWGEIYRLAKEQCVEGLVAAGIDCFRERDISFACPQEWTLRFICQAMQVEQRNKAMNTFIALLIKSLKSANIYALLVKGQGIAQCYAKPEWRTSGDVDLYLSDENYEKAKKILIPLASSVEKEYIREKHLGLTIDGWVVELHGHLYSGLSYRIERELDDVHTDTFVRGNVRTWDTDMVQVFMLAAENDAFYVFTHILQHFYKGGIGLRQICDWCRLLYTYRESLNVELLESRIKRAGLMSEWKVIGAFSVNCLGMPIEAMPFLNHEESTNLKKKADRICQFIMKVGNFGHNRDTSYYGKYPFVVRKTISSWWRTKDLYRHAKIFPFDSLRFSCTIMRNGVRSAMRGE